MSCSLCGRSRGEHVCPLLCWNQHRSPHSLSCEHPYNSVQSPMSVFGHSARLLFNFLNALPPSRTDLQPSNPLSTRMAHLRPYPRSAQAGTRAS